MHRPRASSADGCGPDPGTRPFPARPPIPAAPALAALVLLAATAASPGGLAGQSGTPADPPLPGEAGEPGDGRIDGFWGFPWGADSARIVERLGPPLSVSDAGGGERVLAFTPLYLGRDGYLFLRLDAGGGLTGGSWEPMTSDCTDMMRRLVRATKRAHPRVATRTRGDLRGGLHRDLCEAALEDSVRLEVRWEDGAGNRLRILATPDRPALRMVGSAGPAAGRGGEGSGGGEGDGRGDGAGAPPGGSGGPRSG